MNDDIYVRKEVYEAEKETVATAITATNTRIDDLDKHISRNLGFWGIAIGVIAFLFAGLQVGMAIVLYYLQNTPH